MELKTIKHDNTTYQYIHSKQFKTRVLTIRFLSDLNQVNVTARHLMVSMLKAKNQQTKTRKAQSKYLESLYDTMLYTQASKLGTQHVLQLSFVFINDVYTLEKTLLDEVLSFAKTTIYAPLFDAQSLAEEKQFLKDYFKAEYTNKTRFAHKQYIKHLYQDYPYNKHALGEEDAIDGITLEDINEAHQAMLKESRVFVTFLSDLEDTSSHKKVSEVLRLQSINHSFNPLAKHDFKPKEAISEILEVTQDRLFIALKTNTYMKDERYFTALVFNALLGEGSDSLLFRTIREDMSLAYYVHSSYSPMTGIITMTSGMNQESVSLGKKQMLEIVAAIGKGDFTDEDLHLAKTYLITLLKQSYDHPMSLSLKALRYSLFGVPFQENRLMQSIESVTKEELIDFAQGIQVIFTYQLGGSHENH